MKGKNVYFTREQLITLANIIHFNTEMERKTGQQAHERGDKTRGNRADYLYSIGCELRSKINDAIEKTPSIQNTAQMKMELDDEVPF